MSASSASPVKASSSIGSTATGTAPGSHTHLDERTRDRVLSAVLERGPVSAAELGESLGFTPAAVRRHLDALSGDGLIEIKRLRSPASGAGRPARRYVLSRRGQSAMGEDYLEIARTALASLGQAAGPEAIDDFARARFSRMEERYGPVVDAAGPELESRADALAQALTADGFVGSTREVGSPGVRTGTASAMASLQLCQGHCPIQSLAAEFPAFCEQETSVFARLLGVDVRRLSTLARGGHVCTTHIPLGRSSATPVAPEDAQVSDPAALSNHQQGRPS
ncbi:MarR family transcriptional regulator [Arthrobacter echini]|uniref:MarR family transcriptional regulator n=1 Tax=Arthrobacter echini TaxID=1529066 RepID=A0A4S5E707_9MICC|nr:helix-turn-helix domain-containing protein [Arthrobacter echini]THJ67367.1 MarR family transcriptional regulator [Arthrobacter echini]